MIRADAGFQVDGIEMLTSDAQMRLNDAKRFYWGNGNDAEMWSDGSNLITQMRSGAIWYFRNSGGTSKMLWVPSSNYLRLQDSVQLRFGSGNDAEFFHNGSHMYTDLNLGHWYIRDGTTSRFIFNDSGSFTATGNITAYGSISDLNVKEDVKIIPKALDKVKTLDGILFNYIGDENRMTGVIAQQVRKVLPEAVYDIEPDDEGVVNPKAKMGVRHGNMVGLLIEAIKELSQKVDMLEAERGIQRGYN